MILLAFSVHDAAADAFLPPTFLKSKGEALRAFGDAVNEEGHQFARHAEDYTLFHVGLFDESVGELRPQTPPDSLGNALTFVVAAPPVYGG